jgi:hypothetical protein
MALVVSIVASFNLEQKHVPPTRTLLYCETNEPRVTGPPRLLYDTFGETFLYRPSFHVSPKFN